MTSQTKPPAPAAPALQAADVTHDMPHQSDASYCGSADALVAMDGYHYAQGVVQRRGAVQAAPDTAPLAGSGDAAGTSGAPSKPANRTGLPDGLKAGIEALSGVSLDNVKVHYRSPKPAQLQAQAYARGSEIHLAPGREHHLAHEAWHVVQQAQGRVAPSVQMKRGVPGNDDARLESEADRMGAAALRWAGRYACGAVSRPLRETTARAAQGIVQRKPEDVLKTLPADLEETIALKQVLANARRVARYFPLIQKESHTYASIRYTLRTYVQAASKKSTLGPGRFIAGWNNDVHHTAVDRYQQPDEATESYEVSNPEGYSPGEKTQQDLAHWIATPLSQKEMTPDIKLATIIPMLLTQREFPEDATVALKLFFGHTANFDPVDNLGRDFRANEHGQYYRSSPDPARVNNAVSLKNDAEVLYEQSGEKFPKGYTAQVANPALHAKLIQYGYLKPSIHEMTFIGDDADKVINYAVYKSVGGSHTGSLGLIQNVYRTIQVGTRVEARDPSASTPKWAETGVKDALKAVIPDDQLAPDTSSNYHDFMLEDRSALIARVAEAVRAKYDKKRRGWRVVPIQSPNHASLILELVDKDGSFPLKEQIWRELFIPTFNETAASLKLQTRATHRGSFGFLYPSVSSVGGPVRIWPGLTPPAVFEHLVLGTLDALHVKNPNFQKPRGHASRTIDNAASRSRTPDVALYREALKTAVRYAQDAMHETIAIRGPERFAQWIAVRLQRNLTKAQFLLAQKSPTDAATQEQLYLKSALVIENLMEYSYLLESFNAQTLTSPDSTPHDPYPDYLRNTLGLGSAKHETATFYLDSGMQAIVSANLLARAWTVQRKKIDEQSQLETIDLNSYFEYAAVDKENLRLLTINRAPNGRFLNWTELERALNKRDQGHKAPPSIIAADLNPVLTSSQATESRVDYQNVFKHFAKKNGTGLNDATIPIVDVTNASLAKAAELNLHEGYENFIVLESLSKHQQLGADKYTMGRMSAVGSAAFIELAKKLIGPIQRDAFHRLPATYRLRMDRIFYGTTRAPQTTFAVALLNSANRYDEFMDLMGFGDEWRAENKSADGDVETIRARYAKVRELINQGLTRYKTEVIETAKSPHDLDKAFRALPPADQRDVQYDISTRFSGPSRDEIFVENPFLLATGPGTQTGVTNVGNTCYLAAALNMLAYSPWRHLFAPRDPDARSDLRARVNAVLVNIRAGQRIDYDTVADLLVALDHAELLEGPNAFAARVALNAQRDPSEVLGYLLDYFGAATTPGYSLAQTHTKAIDLPNRVSLPLADPARYSTFDAQGNFAPRQVSDWLIKLPITGAASLQTALTNYLARENIEQVTGVYNGPNQNNLGRGLVYRSRGTSQIALGAQTPHVISIQLVRWSFGNGQIRKDPSAIHMPEQFVLNQHGYRLEAVIYHQGARPNVGHYTTNTRNANGGWDYRDDTSVAPDFSFAQHSGLGYLYTYVDQGVVDLQTAAALLDLANPHALQQALAPLALPPLFGALPGMFSGTFPGAFSQQQGWGGTSTSGNRSPWNTWNTQTPTIGPDLASLFRGTQATVNIDMGDEVLQMPSSTFLDFLPDVNLRDPSSVYGAIEQVVDKAIRRKRSPYEAFGADWSPDRADWDEELPSQPSTQSSTPRLSYKAKRQRKIRVTITFAQLPTLTAPLTHGALVPLQQPQPFPQPVPQPFGTIAFTFDITRRSVSLVTPRRWPPELGYL